MSLDSTALLWPQGSHKECTTRRRWWLKCDSGPSQLASTLRENREIAHLFVHLGFATAKGRTLNGDL